MKNFSLGNFTAAVIWALPVAYFIWAYGTLPATVPLHYNLNGTPNRFGNKSELLILQLFITAISGGLFLLMKYIAVIDPKKQVKYSESTFQKLRIGMVIFLSALSCVITFTTLNRGVSVNKIIFPLIGLLFVFIGNLMLNIKPNYFVGVRTPWTLENPDNWRATHRLAAKIWVTGGVVLTVLVLLLPPPLAPPVFIAGIVIMTLIPVVYSYRYFKKQA